MSESVTIIVESVGTYTMDDGREIKGAIISFPEEAAPFPLSVIWQREPMRLVRETLAEREGTRP